MVCGVATIPRTEIEKLAEHPDELYTATRAVPYFKDGQAKGFKILSVKAETFFDKLGIKRGDILLSINGRLLDLKSGFDTFALLKTRMSSVSFWSGVVSCMKLSCAWRGRLYRIANECEHGRHLRMSGSSGCPGGACACSRGL